MRSLPEFIEAGMAFFEGKTVPASKLTEANDLLNAANARIKELEASAIDPKPLNDRIAALEKEVVSKDAKIEADAKTIKALEENFQTAARQAQEHIARAGATPPVIVDGPKNPEAKDEATQFIEAYTARIGKGEGKGAALSALARENPKLHVAFIKSGKQLP